MSPHQTKTEEALDSQTVVCPKCNAQFVFYRSSSAHIDASGFESYQLECSQCGTPLSGIVDPADNKLLLSRAS
jgi:transcription elongation factor Elf1